MLTFAQRPTIHSRYLLLKDPYHNVTSERTDMIVEGWTLVGVKAMYWPEYAVALVSVDAVQPPEPGTTWALRETQPVEDALELAYWQFKDGKDLPESERDRFKAVIRPLVLK